MPLSKTHLPTHLRTAILVEKRCENYYTLPKISCSYLWNTNKILR